MPKWGLTAEQRDTRPWGIPPELLQPGKTITDPVHGDIHVTKLEQALIDSAPMQRLRGVRQLGTSHMVYPSASHTRFSHALGTLRSAQDLLDAVVNSADGPRPPKKHLLTEWRDNDTFDKEWARATVLARLGALLHDLCHVPFGHTIEDDLDVLASHDANVSRFERLWKQFPQPMQELLGADEEFRRELRSLILSKEDTAEWKSDYPFVADIVGNTICADLMDYLRRDHHAAGLPMQVGVRFIDDFYVVGSDHKLNRRKMVIRIDRQGHVRRDVVSEITKYLRYRYEESERVLFHHAKIAADAMIGKMLEMWADNLWVDRAATYFPSLAGEYAGDLVALRAAIRSEATPPELLASVTASDIRPRRPRNHDEEPNAAELIGLLVESELEAQFTRRSDDGLLEYLRDYGSDRAIADKRIKAINSLAARVLDRRLFKLIGRAEDEAAQSNAEELHRMFGDANVRRDIEMTAAEIAGIEPSWNAVIWLPSPSMRFKQADVLVDKRGSIAKLRKIKEGSAARELVDSHKALWSLNVFASEEVARDKKQVAEFLSALSDEMTVVFTTADGETIPALDELLVERVAEAARLPMEKRSELRLILEGQVAAKGGSRAFQERAKGLFRAAKKNGLIAAESQTPSRI